MELNLKFTRTDLEEILRRAIEREHNLKTKNFYFDVGLIDDRTGMTGFIGVTAFCSKPEPESAIPDNLTEEKKVEEVFVPYGSIEDFDNLAAKALKDYEIDGWKGNFADLKNPRKFVRHQGPRMERGAWYKVTFTRLV